MTAKVYPRIYRFGPVSKAAMLLAGAGLVAFGLWIAVTVYNLPGLSLRFAGLVLSLVPMALALFGVPALWRCRLAMYEDHLEYYGVFVVRVIRKADIQLALHSRPDRGLMSVILTLYGQPLRPLRLAILGRTDALARWLDSATPQRG